MRGFQGRRALTQINLFDGSFDVRFKYLSGESLALSPWSNRELFKNE